MKEQEIAELSTWLTRQHLPLKIEWLKTCVDYLERSLRRKLPLSEETVHLVIQQFLNSKLSETLNPLLKIPTNAAKVIIVKRMIFEMKSYVNISVSLYEQLSEITRHNDDLSWFHGGSNIDHDHEDNREEDMTFNQTDKNNNRHQGFKKRGMFRLELTDGVNTVKAIEMEELFDEKLLVPGVKIILTGSVKCRRGVLLLGKSNCSLLGGRVESLKYDRTKQLSDALKIDLDAEKKRRQESLEKAAASVSSQKKNSSLNQSSISPFLVKTNRKTGEITNIPKAPSMLQQEAPPLSSRQINPEPVENWEDCSIEEIQIIETDTTPKPLTIEHRDQLEHNFASSSQTKTVVQPVPPTKRLSSLVLSKKEDLPKKIVQLEKPQRRDEIERMTEDWTFNSTSSLDKSQNLRKLPVFEPKVKQLPNQLLRTDSNSKVQTKPTSTLGNPSMPVEKRKEITKWIWEDRKGSEEEETSAKRKKDDSIVEIPQCFIKSEYQKSDRHAIDSHINAQQSKMNMFKRTIHGPRKRIGDFRVKQESPEVRITKQFPIVKGTSPITKSLKSSQIGGKAQFERKQNSHETIEFEESDDVSDGIDEVVPVTPHQPHRFDLDGEDNGDFIDEGNEQDDSILECTIEQEGRMECERWGLRGIEQGLKEDNKYRKFSNCGVNQRTHKPDYDAIMRRILPSTPQFHSPLVGTNDQDLSERKYIKHSSHLYPHSAQRMLPSVENWNSEDPTVSSPREKTERADNPDERRLMSMMKIPAKNRFSNQEIEDEIKNKQSANVQIYKTPFAKRLNSTDSSSTTTSKLLQRMSDLQIVPFADALINRKYWMMSKIVVIMPTICHQLHELKSDGVDWVLQFSVTDTSAANVKCRVATVLLNRIFGFNVQQCKNLFNSNQVEELRAKKFEAERKLLGFKRLDLLVWIEVSPDPDKLPLIVDVKTISDALNIL